MSAAQLAQEGHRLFVFRTLAVDDRLAASVPGVQPRVRLLLHLRSAGRVRLARRAYVYFTHNAARYRIALGTSDPEDASRRAAHEHAAIVSGRRRAIAGPKVGTLLELDALLAEWIASLEGALDEETRKTLVTYARHYVAFFRSLDRMTDASCADYGRARLRLVLRKTVQKELSYLRGFLAWCTEQGAIAAPPVVAALPKKATGHRCGPQRAAPVEITEPQAMAIISALPAHSKRIDGRKWPVRDRYRFAWETALRPETLARLRVPEHYTRGSVELRLDDADDKARYGRVLPMTLAAQAVLVDVAPTEGIIFGRHCFNKVLKRAAAQVLGPDIARRFAQYDFRHGRGTHLLDEGAPLTGAAYLLGHKRLSTTDKYLRPSRRAAERVLAAVAVAVATSVPSSPAEARAPRILAPLWHRREVAGGLSGDGDPEKTGVTDGFRTRDNWSHNALKMAFSSRNSRTRRVRKGQERPVWGPVSAPGAEIFDRCRPTLRTSLRSDWTRPIGSR